MPAGGGLAAGLAAAFDAAQGQADRQNKLKMQQLKMQQEALQFQYLQQQAIIGQKSDQFAALQAAGVFDQQPQPPPSPQDVSQMGPRPQPQQQGGPPPQMGGLPGSQPMPGAQPQPQQGGQQMNALLGNIPAGQPAPLLNGRMAGGGAPPPQQGQPQPQQGGGGFGGLQPPPTLQSVAQQVAQQAIKNGLSPQDPNFGPIVMGAARKNLPAMQEAWKNQLEVVKAQQAAKDREAGLAERASEHADREQDVAAQRGLTAAIAGERTQKQGWEIFQKQDGTLLRVNKDTGEVKPMDSSTAGVTKPGATANQPSADDIKTNAKAIANYEEAPPGRGSALSSKTMAEVMRINPDYDAKTYQQRQRAYTAFSTGKQGDTVRSLGVADSHLQVLGDLVKGLGNGNVKLINSAAQAWAEQTGREAPTDFDAVKAIVADEVSKAVIGAGSGTGQDRENILAPFNRKNSPAQLAGAIENYRKLMAGQLSGLRREYENSTGRKDFDKLLPGDMQSSAATPAQSGGWSFEPVK